MMIRLGLTQVSWYQILLSVALLLAATTACLWAGAKIFRLGLLMYGKRPSPKETWRALRQV